MNNKYRVKVQTWWMAEAEVEVMADTERHARELALVKGHAAPAMASAIHQE